MLCKELVSHLLAPKNFIKKAYHWTEMQSFHVFQKAEVCGLAISASLPILCLKVVFQAQRNNVLSDVLIVIRPHMFVCAFLKV